MNHASMAMYHCFLGLSRLGILLLMICAIYSHKPHAQEVRSFESATLNEDTLTLVLSDAELSIRAINEATVEVFYQANGIKQLPSFALASNPSKKQSSELSLSETSDSLTLSLRKLDVHIQKQPFAITYKRGDTVLAQEEVGLFVYDTVRGFRFTLQDEEKILGGGQRVMGMDRRGQRMPLYNRAHYGYTTESNQMYYSLPAVMSTNNYIIAFDNSANGFLDIGHTQSDILQFEASAGRTAYIFSAGETPAELVSNFVEATGKQPLPPRWALGNFASRFGYKTQAQALDTIERFIEQDFPVDALVLDLYWFGPDIKGHMGNLNWHEPTFPEPEKMITQLKQKGVNTILITEPFILSTSSQWDSAVENKVLAKNMAGEPRRFDFYFGNSGLVDVFDENAQEWFWEYYAKLNKQGIAGWWGDLGEPELHPSDSLHKLNGEWVTADEIHNAYGHQWAKMVYERQLSMRPDERPFVMMRSGFLGSQRYGMIPWTGDVERSWGGLKPQVELALQMSLFGLAYTHSDLGGFAGGETFDSELYARWMQYGVFQPVYRPHAQDNIAPEPVFHDEATQDLVRPFVKLRYQLLPYNYSLSMQNSLYGKPMMRPLFYEFDDADISRTDAYMWGDALLVSPIVSPNVREQIISLPEGIWFNFYGNDSGARPSHYHGGQAVTIPAPLNETPVLVKGGAFIPMIDAIQNTQSYSTENLRVRHYTHESVSSSNYDMLDDDGTNPHSLRDNQYQRLRFSSERNEQYLKIGVKLEGSYDLAPKSRQVVFEVHGLNARPTELQVDDATVNFLNNLELLDDKTGAYWDDISKRLWVSGVFVKDLAIEVLPADAQ